VFNQAKLSDEELVASTWSWLEALGYHRIAVEHMIELYFVEADFTESVCLKTTEFTVENAFLHIKIIM